MIVAVKTERRVGTSWYIWFYWLGPGADFASAAINDWITVDATEDWVGRAFALPGPEHL